MFSIMLAVAAVAAGAYAVWQIVSRRRDAAGPEPMPLWKDAANDLAGLPVFVPAAPPEPVSLWSAVGRMVLVSIVLLTLLGLVGGFETSLRLSLVVGPMFALFGGWAWLRNRLAIWRYGQRVPDEQPPDTRRW